MTLRAFQRALCDLIASPRLCLALRRDPESVLGSYDLTPLERRRLTDAVWQRGMSTNCTIYRSNRITPIYTLLNSTCFLLGDAFAREVELFWETGQCLDLQYGPEIERFGRFLKERLRSGALHDPVLEEVLDFELATYALQFSPRRQILRDLERSAVVGGVGARLHPMVRVVLFRHDPTAVLQRVAARELPPYALAEGQFFVLLSVIHGPLEVKGIDPEMGARLLGLQRGDWVPSRPEEVAPLIDAGLLVCSDVASPLQERH